MVSGFKFYAVIGDNGVSIATSENRVKTVKRYIRNGHSYGFYTYKEARDYLLCFLKESGHPCPRQFPTNCVYNSYLV